MLVILVVVVIPVHFIQRSYLMPTTFLQKVRSNRPVIRLIIKRCLLARVLMCHCLHKHENVLCITCNISNNHFFT